MPHKEYAKVLEKNRRYKARNQERLREKDRQYRAAHQEQIRATNAAYREQHRTEKRERDRVRAMQRTIDRRQKLLALLGSHCVRCGYDADWRALEIDHISGGGAQDRKAARSLGAYYQAILDCGGVGYQILCANCNRIKRYENREYRPRQFP
jgi:hypothetical protein